MATDREQTFPSCECGFCHGPNVPLPMEAWSVAGYGDLDRLAVHEDHAGNYEDAEHEIEWHKGWAAVARV